MYASYHYYIPTLLSTLFVFISVDVNSKWMQQMKTASLKMDNDIIFNLGCSSFCCRGARCEVWGVRCEVWGVRPQESKNMWGFWSLCIICTICNFLFGSKGVKVMIEASILAITNPLWRCLLHVFWCKTRQN